MNTKQLHALTLRGTDVNGALNRCCKNEQLYADCLKQFLNDKTLSQLSTAIDDEAWDDAFTAAHALKGLAGNMGFIPLMHATGHLVIVIRGGRTKEVHHSMVEVENCYRDIIDAILKFVSLEKNLGGKSNEN